LTRFLFIEEQPMEGVERPAAPGTTIGRAECDVELNDPDVSRRHAVVRLVDGGLAVEDLGSTNGTFVNERRITGIAELAAGDRVRFGNTVWRLTASSTADDQRGLAGSPVTGSP
jgi:pSer/pThr/pTyr-binding forkhead associated (FHA) protein